MDDDTELAIGSTLYSYDQNRRRYFDDDGQPSQVCNPRSYWMAHAITDETRTAWIVDKGRYKVQKTTLKIYGIRDQSSLYPSLFKTGYKLEREWMEVYHHLIVNAVRQANYETVRQVGALLGIGTEEAGSAV